MGYIFLMETIYYKSVMISGRFLVGFETSKSVPKSFTQLKPIVMAGGPDILLENCENTVPYRFCRAQWDANPEGNHRRRS